MSGSQSAPRRIDMHAHFYPLVSKADAAVLGLAEPPWLRDNGDGTGHMMEGDRDYRPVEARLWDAAARVAEMDALGTTIQVISPTPMLFSYAVETAAALDWSQMVNASGLAMAHAFPDRLRSLCQVPMQDVDMACAEVSRCFGEGHVGVHIGNHVNGRNLDDAKLEQFLDHCAAEGIPVLVHPWDMMAPDRMPKYMLKWLVGMPAETHLAILSLILSGAFDRLPESLRISFTHGGGNFAAQLARVDNAWHRRDIVRADSAEPPSSYARRFFVDSAVFGDEQLRLLASVMGTDRIMMGSDYPFPLGELEPGDLIETSVHLTDADKTAMLYDNAAGFFKL